MKHALARLRELCTREVWQRDLRRLGPLRRLPLRTLRVLLITGRGFHERDLLLRASALTYVTVLSLVPMLAFAFALAKGFGAYEVLRRDSIAPFVSRTFGEDGGAAGLRHTIDQVLDFVDRTNVSNLGLFGLVTLIYTVIKLLASVEHSFNDIWEVKRARSFARRVADYIAIAIIAPVLLITATGITAAVQANQIVGYLSQTLHLTPLIDLALRLAPLVAVWIGFTLLYLVMPNTRVRVRSAALGGIVGGTLWQLAQVLHVKFQIGVAVYNALYAGFAAIPVFLVWLFASWVIVLLGAQLAAAQQLEPRYRGLALDDRAEPRVREQVALRCMTRIARAFVEGAPPLAAAVLAQELRVPDPLVEEVLETLADHGVLARAIGGAEPRYLPARDLEQITLKSVVDAVHAPGRPMLADGRAFDDARVDLALAALERERETSPYNLTLRELVRG